MHTKRYILLALVIGLAFGVGGWLVFAPKNTTPIETTVTDLGNGYALVTTGSSTITEIKDDPKPTVTPPAVVALSISADLPVEAKAALQSQFNTYAAGLKAAPARTDLWLSLGIVYKIAGQYQAAASAWTYVGKAGGSTVNYVAYGNLGDLYLNFTHEYAKAETSFKAALALKPGVADYQAGLAAAREAQGK